MVPYADFLYFGILSCLGLVNLVPGLTGRFRRPWLLVATAIMLCIQYSAKVAVAPKIPVREIWLVLGYAAYEWLVAFVFLLLTRPLGSPEDRRLSRARNAWAAYPAVLLALFPLVATKAAPVLAPNYVIGFVGISYLTFRSVDVVFSVNDHLVSSLPPIQYLAYLLFFPAISSGPIDRYRRFLRDYGRARTRGEFLDDLDGAINRISTGFLYKFILARLVETYWMSRVAKCSGLGQTVSYMYAYSLYLFFDFAGYSAFAIGIGYFFGIHMPENFDRPFLATNIREFWNRWHISLSSWLRDHVYMRFVMAATKRRWFTTKYTASYIGFFLSMGLMGLWHGTQWNYIAYGLYHAVLLVTLDILARWNKKRGLWGNSAVFKAAGIFITVNLVCFGLLIFSGGLNHFLGL